MEYPARKNMRLPEYDYSKAGAYFLTLCVKGRNPIFWESRGELCSPGQLSDVGRVVKQFKGVVTKRLGFSPWQRSFYEHVIRNEQDYLETWEYIDNNPRKETR